MAKPPPMGRPIKAPPPAVSPAQCSEDVDHGPREAKAADAESIGSDDGVPAAKPHSVGLPIKAPPPAVSPAQCSDGTGHGLREAKAAPPGFDGLVGRTPGALEPPDVNGPPPAFSASGGRNLAIEIKAPPPGFDAKALPVVNGKAPPPSFSAVKVPPAMEFKAPPLGFDVSSSPTKPPPSKPLPSTVGGTTVSALGLGHSHAALGANDMLARAMRETPITSTLASKAVVGAEGKASQGNAYKGPPAKLPGFRDVPTLIKAPPPGFAAPVTAEEFAADEPSANAFTTGALEVRKAAPFKGPPGFQPSAARSVDDSQSGSPRAGSVAPSAPPQFLKILKRGGAVPTGAPGLAPEPSVVSGGALCGGGVMGGRTAPGPLSVGSSAGGGEQLAPPDALEEANAATRGGRGASTGPAGSFSISTTTELRKLKPEEQEAIVKEVLGMKGPSMGSADADPQNVQAVRDRPAEMPGCLGFAAAPGGGRGGGCGATAQGPVAPGLHVPWERDDTNGRSTAPGLVAPWERRPVTTLNALAPEWKPPEHVAAAAAAETAAAMAAATRVPSGGPLAGQMPSGLLAMRAGGPGFGDFQAPAPGWDFDGGPRGSDLMTGAAALDPEFDAAAPHRTTRGTALAPGSAVGGGLSAATPTVVLELSKEVPISSASSSEESWLSAMEGLGPKLHGKSHSPPLTKSPPPMPTEFAESVLAHWADGGSGRDAGEAPAAGNEDGDGTAAIHDVENGSTNDHANVSEAGEAYAAARSASDSSDEDLALLHAGASGRPRTDSREPWELGDDSEQAADLELDVEHPPEVLKDEIRRHRREIEALRSTLAKLQGDTPGDHR